MSMTLDERTPVERAANADLELWPAEYQAWADGVHVPLPPRQFELLLFLVRREGHVVTREQIFEAVWRGRLSPGDRVVDVHVYKLRSKLRSVSPTWRYIHTHHAIGYRFDPERISS